MSFAQEKDEGMHRRGEGGGMPAIWSNVTMVDLSSEREGAGEVGQR